MTFRTRLFLWFGAVVLATVAGLGLLVRWKVTERLEAEYQRRVQSLVGVIAADLDQQSAVIAGRLEALKRAMADDNRFRLAAVQESPAERGYLLDYAAGAMRVTGLSMLEILDGDGRILSSGHFRNEYDRLDPDLPRLLAAAHQGGGGGGGGGVALVQVRTAGAPFLALARVDSLRLGGRRFTVVGGVMVDADALARLSRDQALSVVLAYPGGELRSRDSAGPAADAVVSDLLVPYLDATADSLAPAEARIVVTQSLEPVRALRRSVDALFVAALGLGAGAALLFATLLSTRMSRPLAELAEKTAAIDLDRLDVDFRSERTDEVGALARLLGAMTDRLRTGAARLREAERRFAIGDLARQVNHDIKNGLIPIRNVFRHLAQIARERPQELPQVFAERQGTIESSVAYLETLAGNYAKLSPKLEAEACDANDVVRQAVHRQGRTGAAVLETSLAEDLPRVRTDPLVLRRIVENLVGNALDALDGSAGTVRVSTERLPGGGQPQVRLVVADTGKGMTKAELDRAFDDFFTTKPGGTGLGLSIVRRLVLDANGALRVETEPGSGSRFIVELPGEDAAP